MKMSFVRFLLSSTFIISFLLLSPSRSLGQAFTNTGSMTQASANHTATLLNNGKVLLVGGVLGNGSGANLYDPATGAFSATGSMLGSPNANSQTATLLNTGLVLVTSGNYWAELYNPTTGTFTQTGNMTTSRTWYTATLLNSGMVLFVGGYNSCGRGICNALASAELYNPATGTFTATGSLNTGRNGHTATLLNNGKVLITGGYLAGNGVTSSAELYDPSTGLFAVTGSMTVARARHIATSMQGGLVLIAGSSTAASSTAELYNSSTGSFSSTGGSISGPLQMFNNSATLLNDGTVLFVAEVSNGLGNGIKSAAEVYNPTTGAFAATATMNTARYANSATLLSNGQVLIAGGWTVNGYTAALISSAELYTPGPGVTGYVDPKFIVVGVTYAPPGPSPSTFVTYGNSTTIGTTNSLSQSFMTGHTYTSSLSFGSGIPMVESGRITSQYSSTSSQMTSNNSTVTTTFQTSTAEKTGGTGLYMTPVNNDYDTIWVWLNPAIILTVSTNTETWNGYGLDMGDQPGMDIVGIPLGYLNGHFGTMPPDIQTSLNRGWAANQVWPAGQGPALTTADLAQIASADPFSDSTYGTNYIHSAPPSPETSDFRFTMSTCTNVASFSYLQAAPSQTPATYTCILNYTTNSTQAKGIATTYSQTFSVDQSLSVGPFFSNLSLDLKNSNTLTWTTGEQSSISNSTSSTGSLSVQGPPCNNAVPQVGPCIPVYDSSGDQPTQFYVYQDNMFGAFMFAPVHFY